MDLLRLLTSYEQANREQLKQHQTVSNLNKILDDDKFYYVNDDITFKGEIKRTTNSIVTILCNVAGEPSNLAIYPLDGSKPFLLNHTAMMMRSQLAVPANRGHFRKHTRQFGCCLCAEK